MSVQPHDISVTWPLGQAMERVKDVLFRPFDLAKWFAIGFCAWLAHLGQSGFYSGYNNKLGSPRQGAESLRHAFEQARDYVRDNLAWILPLAIAVTVVGLVIWLVLLFLSSRGHFMFIHCIALNRGEVSVPWALYGREANSLFLFRLVLTLAGMAFTLPLLGGLVLLGLGMMHREQASMAGVLWIVCLGLAMFTFGIVFWLINWFTREFVVPIQYLRRSSCIAAWRELLRLSSGNVSQFVLYVLFRIVLAIAIFLLELVLVLATCCIAGCLFALPYLGTVLLLPIIMFRRSFSLYYLAQFGPEYNVFPPSAPAAM
jgi:hypothetical protein